MMQVLYLAGKGCFLIETTALCRIEPSQPNGHDSDGPSILCNFFISSRALFSMPGMVNQRGATASLPSAARDSLALVKDKRTRYPTACPARHFAPSNFQAAYCNGDLKCI